MGVGLALIASAAWGVSDFVGGLKAKSVPIVALLAVTQPLGLVLLAGVALVGGRHSLGGLGTLYAALAGAAGIVGVGCLYRGLAVGTMGIVAPITATAPLVPVIVGIGRGERPSPIQGAGIALALGGIVLASREPVAGRTSRIAAGALLGAAAAVLFGCSLLGLQAASAHDPYWGPFALRVSSTVLVLLALAFTRPPLASVRPAMPALVLVAGLDVTATTLFSVATTKGLISLIAVLASLYPIGIVLLARIVLGERLRPIQQVGAFAALAGAAMISAG